MATDTSNSVEGRVVLITGAGQGIGRAYAHHFAEAGAVPVIAELNGQNGERVAAEIETAGGRALAVSTDVTSPDSVQHMVDTAMTELGRIDVLINNAAIFSQLERRGFEDIPLAEWEDVMRVNVTGSMLCARAVLPAMRAAKWGRIINISSSTVPMGLPNFTHYVTSKAAVVGMTRAMARELGPDGITVNAMMPGLTETEVDNLGRTDQIRHKVIDMQAVKRLEVPDDLVGMVMFLASPASGFITGQSLVVDGGSAFL